MRNHLTLCFSFPWEIEGRRQVFGKELRMAESHREDQDWSWYLHTQPGCQRPGNGAVCVQCWLFSQATHLSSFREWPGRQLFASLGWEGKTHTLLSLLLHIPKASFLLPRTSVETGPDVLHLQLFHVI